jgi:hypothetical protein
MAKLPPFTALARSAKAAIVKTWFQNTIRKNESYKRIHNKKIQKAGTCRQYLQTYKFSPPPS